MCVIRRSLLPSMTYMYVYHNYVITRRVLNRVLVLAQSCMYMYTYLLLAHLYARMCVNGGNVPLRSALQHQHASLRCVSGLLYDACGVCVCGYNCPYMTSRQSPSNRCSRRQTVVRPLLCMIVHGTVHKHVLVSSTVHEVKLSTCEIRYCCGVESS